MVLPQQAEAHAKAKTRSQCKNNKRYYVKAKANGPGCDKQKVKDWSCQGLDTGWQTVWRFELNGSPSCICTTTGGGFVAGADARAVSTANGMSESTFKTTACSGYKAGGLVPESAGELLPSGKDGTNENRFEIGGIHFDEAEDRIYLTEILGSLHVDADDFVSEYSVIDLAVNLIHETSSGDIAEPMWTVRFSIENGEFSVTGSNNVFSSSDFSVDFLGDGWDVTYVGGDKGIPIAFDATMWLELELTGDVGNVRDDPSNNEKMAFNVFPTDGSADDISITLQSGSHYLKNVEVSIYDLQGRQVVPMVKKSLAAGSSETIRFDYNALPPRNFLLIMVRTEDDIVQVKKVFIP
jgi:hypothetical protein